MAKQKTQEQKKSDHKYKTLSEKMSSGNHRGKTMKEVVENDPLYLEWALKHINGFSLSIGIRNALKKRLGRELKED